MDPALFNLTWDDKSCGKQTISLCLGASVQPEPATEENPTPEWSWHVHLGDVPGLEKTDWGGMVVTCGEAKLHAEFFFRAALDLAMVHSSREKDDDRSA